MKKCLQLGFLMVLCVLLGFLFGYECDRHNDVWVCGVWPDTGVAPSIPHVEEHVCCMTNVIKRNHHKKEKTQ